MKKSPHVRRSAFSRDIVLTPETVYSSSRPRSSLSLGAGDGHLGRAAGEHRAFKYGAAHRRVRAAAREPRRPSALARRGPFHSVQRRFSGTRTSKVVSYVSRFQYYIRFGNDRERFWQIPHKTRVSFELVSSSSPRHDALDPLQKKNNAESVCEVIRPTWSSSTTSTKSSPRAPSGRATGRSTTASPPSSRK